MSSILSSVIGSQTIDELFVVVAWPYVQDLFDYDWFESECYLQLSEQESDVTPVSYFVPISRLLALTQPG
jgi:hypothetical protein